MLLLAKPGPKRRYRYIIVWNAILSLFALALIALMPSSDGRYGVFTMTSDQSAFEVIARAGGQIVTGTGSGRIAIARSEYPDFWRRLYASGALLVFNPLLATGCH